MSEREAVEAPSDGHALLPLVGASLLLRSSDLGRPL